MTAFVLYKTKTLQSGFAVYRSRSVPLRDLIGVSNVVPSQPFVKPAEIVPGNLPFTPLITTLNFSWTCSLFLYLIGMYFFSDFPPQNANHTSGLLKGHSRSHQYMKNKTNFRFLLSAADLVTYLFSRKLFQFPNYFNQKRKQGKQYRSRDYVRITLSRVALSRIAWLALSLALRDD